jgi:uncharacterized protein YndB with AHSA1/START domain
MSVKVEKSGRRSIQVEVEVPGTREQVWQAIASGPGISSWFAPTEIEAAKDGTPERVITEFAPGMKGDAKVTAWEPNKRFTAESPGWAPGMPKMATEWTVEARSGGTCIVRVVHSLFASTDDWDDQLTGVESGWPAFFAVLKHYLAHSAGQPSGFVQLMGGTNGPVASGWLAVTKALNFRDMKKGEKVRTSGEGVPALGGVVGSLGSEKHPGAVILLEQPCPGAAIVGVHDCGGPLMVSLSLYLYGANAKSVAEREQRNWQKWMETNFPMAANASPGA